MNKLKLQSFIISVVVFSFILAGCGWSEVFKVPDSEEVFREAEWTRQQEAQFDRYIGKTSQEIQLTFGKPRRLFKANPPSYVLPYWADEMWRYDTLSVGEGGMHNFLFKENRLINVQVLGKKGKVLYNRGQSPIEGTGH